jgi:hypothetical protein
VTGSTQNLRTVEYKRVVPVPATVSGVMPRTGMVFGMRTLVQGTVCSKQ